MKTLEDHVVARVKRGDLTHFSLFPTPNGWQCNVAGVKNNNGYFIGEDKDPLRACEIAFSLKEPNSVKKRRDDDI